MEHLKEIRRKKALTMKQLGSMIGVAESTISLYESGKRQPDNETLLKLADALNVSIDYLLGREEHSSTLDEKLSEEEFALFGEARDLTDDEKEKVLDFIKFTKSQRDKNKTVENNTNVKVAAKKETPPNPLKDIGRTHT